MGVYPDNEIVTVVQDLGGDHVKIRRDGTPRTDPSSVFAVDRDLLHEPTNEEV